LDGAAVEGTGAQALELATRQRSQRQYKGEPARTAKIKRRRAGGEKRCEIVLRRELATDIDAEALRQFPEPLLQIGAHMAECDPGRIADDYIRPAAAG